MTKNNSRFKWSGVIEIGVILVIFGFIFQIGYWKCSIDKSQEILALKQQHNDEMTTLTLKHQQELMEMAITYQGEISSIQTELIYLKNYGHETK